MKEIKRDDAKPPRFSSEAAEAKWWASAAGRRFLKLQTQTTGRKQKGSPLVASLNRPASVQIT